MTAMEDIKRIEVDDFWADSTVVEAGDRKSTRLNSSHM